MKPHDSETDLKNDDPIWKLVKNTSSIKASDQFVDNVMKNIEPQNIVDFPKISHKKKVIYSSVISLFSAAAAVILALFLSGSFSEPQTKEIAAEESTTENLDNSLATISDLAEREFLIAAIDNPDWLTDEQVAELIY